MSYNATNNKSNSKGIIEAFMLRRNRLVPPGTVQTFAGSVAPSGWLLCDGNEYTPEQYILLYNAIGTIYGGGEGTFQVPDMRSRFALGLGNGDNELSVRTIGVTGGAETHTLTTNEIPSHNHSITDPGHSHSYTNNTNDQSVNDTIITESSADNAELSQTTGVNTTGITVNSTGGGQAHNNMPPYMVLNYIIKY